MKLQAQEKLHEKLGLFLREERTRSGLTQSEVASKLGYSSPQFISNFERGLCSPPIKQLKLMVKLYKMDAKKVIDLILTEQESMLKSALLGSGAGKRRN